MAAGDWTTFEELVLDIYKGVHGDLSAAVLKVALINGDATIPAASTATPRWADFSANEVSGTGYTAGGETLANVTVTEVGGVLTLDADDVTWTQNAAGPTDIYYAVVVNTSAAADQCLGFMDMGGPLSLVGGNVGVVWHASGILTDTVVA